jgi:hypothetical protein
MSTAASLNKVALEGETPHQRRATMAPKTRNGNMVEPQSDCLFIYLLLMGQGKGKRRILVWEVLSSVARSLHNLESQGSSNKPIGMGVEFL